MYNVYMVYILYYIYIDSLHTKREYIYKIEYVLFIQDKKKFYIFILYF